MSSDTYEKSIASTEVMIKLLVAQQQLSDGMHVNGERILQQFKERYKYNDGE